VDHERTATRQDGPCRLDEHHPISALDFAPMMALPVSGAHELPTCRELEKPEDE